jgi:ribose transport system substrate-binding protein
MTQLTLPPARRYAGSFSNVTFSSNPRADIMRRDPWFRLVFCCAALLLLIGCTGDTPPGAAGAGGKSGATGSNAGGNSATPGDFKIVILTNGSSPFWDACDRGLKDAGNELGVRVELVRNDATEGGQIRRLEQLATQNDVKGIGVSVLESQASGVVEQMQALRAKGIKVITVDSDGPPEGREAFVGTNNLEAGRELGRLAAQLRPGGGKAVAFVGILGAQNAQERIKGLGEGLGKKIELVDSMEDGVNESKARNNVTAAIQNHPDVNILAGIWSYNAPAITDVISASGRRKDFTIVAFDAEPSAIGAMDQGLIDAMVVQNPYEMGYTGVKLLHRLITGDKDGAEELLKGGDVIDTGLKVIVPDENSPVKSKFRMTLEKFKGWLAEKGLEGS